MPVTAKTTTMRAGTEYMIHMDPDMHIMAVQSSTEDRPTDTVMIRGHYGAAYKDNVSCDVFMTRAQLQQLVDAAAERGIRAEISIDPTGTIG